MNPTPRRRRSSNEFDTPDMSGDSSSDPVLEMKKIQEFVERFPDQLKEAESAVEELKKIADDIHNDKDASGNVMAVHSNTGRRVWFGTAIVLAGLVLAPFIFGATLALSAVVAGGRAAVAGKDYNKKLEDISENARCRMTELGRSAATAIAAVLNLKRLSGSPDTAADPDHEKVFEMLKTDSGLRDLTERMEELLGASGTDTADSQKDQIAENVFPNDLGQLFSVILSFKSKEEKNEKASKIRECAEKLEENLQAVREIHTAMKTLST